MKTATEPRMLISASNLIELIECRRRLCEVLENRNHYETKQDFNDDFHEYEHEYNKAAKLIRKFNRQTLVN